MKTYRIMKEVRADSMFDAIKNERFFHPKEVVEVSEDNKPIGYDEYDRGKPLVS